MYVRLNSSEFYRREFHTMLLVKAQYLSITLHILIIVEYYSSYISIISNTIHINHNTSPEFWGHHHNFPKIVVMCCDFANLLDEIVAHHPIFSKFVVMCYDFENLSDKIYHISLICF